MCQFLHAPITTHWTTAKQILCYVHGTLEVSITFQRSSYTLLSVFSDANWAWYLDDRCSSGWLPYSLAPNSSHGVTENMLPSLAPAPKSNTKLWPMSRLKLFGYKLCFASSRHHSLPLVWQFRCHIIICKYPVFHTSTKHTEINFHFARERVASKEPGRSNSYQLKISWHMVLQRRFLLSHSKNSTVISTSTFLPRLRLRQVLDKQLY
jgi:hypothetical protein